MLFRLVKPDMLSCKLLLSEDKWSPTTPRLYIIRLNSLIRMHLFVDEQNQVYNPVTIHLRKKFNPLLNHQNRSKIQEFFALNCVKVLLYTSRTILMDISF